MINPIRVIVFPERPEAILVVVGDGFAGEVRLPALAAPFDKPAVAYALGTAGIAARVVEEAPGRWTGAMNRARNDARSEAKSKSQAAQAVAMALGLNSADGIVRERSELLRQKNEIDAEIASLKTKIGQAKSDAATRGKYMPPADFRRLEARLERAKVESQALQAKLSELRQAEKDRNRQEETERRARLGGTFHERFVKAAKEVLDPDEFADLCEAADDEGAEAAE